MTARHDILVIGSGIAGLSTGLAAAPRRVAVLSRGLLGDDGASRWAQGGIAAALGADDRPTLHALDTLAAGQHLNDADRVRKLTEGAADAVAWLEAIGTRFDRRDGELRLGREAAHSRSRIVHAQGDATGAEVMRALVAATRAAPHVTLIEHACALELLRDSHGAVIGVAAAGPTGIETHLAAATVLATGGIGALYRYSTNPASADGSGLALALHAGAVTADLEFVQFHPTALAPRAGEPGQLPLLTEALRGVGAILIDETGRRFMPRYAAQAELAPRDVVARAVYAELQSGRRVFLDATRAVGTDFPQRFPTAFAACMARDIDPRVAPVPVVPAEHYHMGGVRTDACDASSVPGLYAVGEVAASGVHGANRLASNSLLEGLVFGRALGRHLQHLAVPPVRVALPRAGSIDAPPTRAIIRNVRDLLWNHVGLVRDADGLARAMNGLRSLMHACAGNAADRACVAVALAIAQAALQRENSIGAHFRSDAKARVAVAIG